jgi:hypothetical protein
MKVVASMGRAMRRIIMGAVFPADLRRKHFDAASTPATWSRLAGCA